MSIKKTARIFCFVLTLVLVLGACGQSSTPPATTPAPPATTPPAGTAPATSGGASAPAAAEPITFQIYLAGATPGGGGVWDMVGAGLAEAILRSNQGSSVTVVPGGGVSDVPVVANKEAELGLTHSIIASAGVTGDDPFDEAYPNVLGVAAFYPSQFQIIIDPEMGISSIKDIKTNQTPIRLAVGDPGSTGELATKRILEAAGITYEDITGWGGEIVYKDMSEAAGMYGDDIVDGFTLLTLAPAGPLQQVATSKEVQLLSIEEDLVKFVEDKYAYAPDIVPQDAYAFLTGDVATFGSYTVVVTSDDRPEQEIYQITKAFIENIDYIKSIHANLADMQEADLIMTGVELHPGAIRAYEEAGIL